MVRGVQKKCSTNFLCLPNCLIFLSRIDQARRFFWLSWTRLLRLGRFSKFAWVALIRLWRGAWFAWAGLIRLWTGNWFGWSGHIRLGRCAWFAWAGLMYVKEDWVLGSRALKAQAHIESEACVVSNCVGYPLLLCVLIVDLRCQLGVSARRALTLQGMPLAASLGAKTCCVWHLLRTGVGKVVTRCWLNALGQVPL